MILLIILTGLIIVALPDSGPRLFSFGKDHGPSLQDVVGLLLILTGYIWLLVIAWKRKEKVMIHRGSPVYRAGIFLSGIGYGLILASVISDFKYWWIVGIILLVIIHFAVLYIVFK